MARRVDSSSNSLGSSLPTVFSTILPSCFGRSGFADSRTLCAPPCNLKLRTPIPEVNGQLLRVSGISLSGNRQMIGGDSLTFQTPNADARCHVSSSAPSPWDPSQLGTSLFLRAPFDFENAEVPSPDSSGSRATCPSDDRRLRLSRGIATRDFDVHATLALANPDVPKYDGKRVPLAPGG
jgi:hypothetical protein